MTTSPQVTEQELLNAAWYQHHTHAGVFKGSNFVECPNCQFHVHTGTVPADSGPADRAPVLWKHWKAPGTYDRIPITSPSDPRLGKPTPRLLAAEDKAVIDAIDERGDYLTLDLENLASTDGITLDGTFSAEELEVIAHVAKPTITPALATIDNLPKEIDRLVQAGWTVSLLTHTIRRIYGEEA